MKTQTQKGFTLIELMVVIVIIGILAALAIPKMMGVSAKAKAAEAPTAIATWETLASAYAQETGADGTAGKIGFVASVSKWYTTDTSAAGTLKETVALAFGNCTAALFWSSVHTITGDTFAHAAPTVAQCADYTPNF